MIFGVQPEAVLAIITAGLMGVLAVWLLYLDFNKLANRVFASLLMLRGLNILFGLLRASFDDAPDMMLWMQRMLPYALIPIIPVTILFICVYPRPRTWFGRTRTGRWSLVALALVAEALYAWDHTLFWTYGFDSAGATLASARPGIHYSAYGPLVIFGSAQTLAFGCLAFVLARDYVRDANASPRYSLFLIYAGFALNSLLDGTVRLAQLARSLYVGETFPWDRGGWLFAIPPALTLVPVVASLFVLARYSLRTTDDTELRHLRTFAFVAPFPVASGLFLTLGGAATAYLATSSAYLALNIWRFALPLLVSYALLRYNLFDLDMRVKWTIKHGTLVGIPISVFFVVSEAAEAFVESQAGPIYGLAAAGTLALVFKRLETLSAQVASRLMPTTKPVMAMTALERMDLFQEQLDLARHDGEMSARERLRLDRLRERLGLGVESFPARPRASSVLA